MATRKALQRTCFCKGEKGKGENREKGGGEKIYKEGVYSLLRVRKRCNRRGRATCEKYFNKRGRAKLRDRLATSRRDLELGQTLGGPDMRRGKRGLPMRKK